MAPRPTLLFHGPDAATVAERWTDGTHRCRLVGVDPTDSPAAVETRVDCAVVEPTADRTVTELVEAVRDHSETLPVIVVNRGVVPDLDSVLPEGAWTQVTVPEDADPVAVLERCEPLADRLVAQRRERSMLDSLLSNVPVSVYFKDRDARHVAVSDAMLDMIGPPYIENEEGKRHHTPEDVAGKTDFDLYPADLASETVADDAAVVESGTPIENRVERSWGEEGRGTYVATSKAPWYGPDGDVRGIVGITRDISERKQYEYQLERQNERLRRFATMVSHDIRNPLSVALGRLELVADEADPEHAAAIERSLDRIDTLVREMLRVMRLGESVMDPDTVRLDGAARDVWAGLATGGATLEVATESTVYADASKLDVLLEMLFQNALDHGTATDGGGGPDGDDHDGATDRDLTLTIGDLEEADGFYVADDGAGIPVDRRERLLEPGLSSANETNIGLSLVVAIADAHNWSIEVTESESGGGRFEFHGVRRFRSETDR